MTTTNVIAMNDYSTSEQMNTLVPQNVLDFLRILLMELVVNKHCYGYYEKPG